MNKYYIKNKTKNIIIFGDWVNILPYDIEMIFLDYYLETDPEDIIIIKKIDTLIRWDQKNKKWIFNNAITFMLEEKNISDILDIKIKEEKIRQKRVIEFPVEIFLQWLSINNYDDIYDDVRSMYMGKDLDLY